MIAAPVATLNVTVRTSRMPHGSEFKRITKAIEHLYYLTLFSSVPDYARRGDAWQSWLDAGTDLAVREAPKAVAREDRYVESVYSGAREIRFAVHGNAQALEQLSELLHSPSTIASSLQVPAGRFQELVQQSVASLSVGDVTGIEVTLAGR
ncbi:MAG TPA: hypothetical protein VFC09_07605 [Candidatus Dormibacteraeota bacterium]|nr:hypothetical protein [Candidatus Dormibacteraeota bacterium]